MDPKKCIVDCKKCRDSHMKKKDDDVIVETILPVFTSLEKEKEFCEFLWEDDKMNK